MKLGHYISITAGFVIVFLIGYFINRHIRDLVAGYESREQASLQESKIFKDRENHWRIQAQAAELNLATVKDLVKNGDPELKALIKDFNLKRNAGNLASYSNVATHTETRYNLQLKDTLILIRDTLRARAKHFEYFTEWDTLKGVVYNDSVHITRSGIDSLDQVVYWKRKWILARKKYFSEIRSKNPDTKIIYNKSLVIGRKRKGIF